MQLLKVYGIVQGVGFRPFIWRIATAHGLKGYVHNKGGYVEIALEGDLKPLNSCISDIRTNLPPQASIDLIEKSKAEDVGFKTFSIIPSEVTTSDIPSGIPPDIRLCESCKQELFTPTDRRYGYSFINCTDCGPRFTIISKVPYDRCNTSMDAFPLCDECVTEYASPSNRRYHAEPLACASCGPVYELTLDGAIVKEEPIRAAARLLDTGKLVAIKGYGGFHIACDATNKEAVDLLRIALDRKYQPFALMVRDLDVLQDVLQVSDKESRHLFSSAAPIVVLRRSRNKLLPASIAPGLETVGVMLPYAPLHHLLFSHVKTSFLVMTSANYPGRSMITELDDAKADLPFIDNFLSHNLRIQNRCDDSVIRNDLFIRRSRGFVPMTIPVPHEHTTLAFGAEINNVVALSKHGKCMLSQHIGDTANWDVLESALDSIDMLMALHGVSRSSLDYILCDMHPRYNTAKVARKWADELSVPCIEVQHHTAHSFGIAGEYGTREALCIAADGMGYGSDGNIWGGEVFYTDMTLEGTRRLGHLEYLKMPGGDLSTKYPLRMLIPLFDDKALERYSHCFSGGMQEIQDIRTAAGSSPLKTSSCGRVLDAVSAILGLSYERTYEGEGAMRLESLALKGSDISLPLEVEGGIAQTGEYLVKLMELLPKYSKADIAKSVHMSLARAFTDIVLEYKDLKLPVGFSGGVAYNELISKKLRTDFKRHGVKFLEHRNIPPGDGGISFGQSCMKPPF